MSILRLETGALNYENQYSTVFFLDMHGELIRRRPCHSLYELKWNSVDQHGKRMKFVHRVFKCSLRSFGSLR